MNNFIGKEGFYWWQGVVEDRMDPLKIGRCRVRILGIHTDDNSISGIPTSDLPWATLLLPANQEEDIKPPKDGSWVLGFFRDGDNCQDPVIIGVIPGISEEPSPNKKDTQKELRSGFFDSAENLDIRPINIGTGFIVEKELGLATSKRDTETEDSIKDINVYPRLVNEPDTSRVARNDEDFSPGIVQWKIDTRDIDVQTGRIGSYWSEPNPADVYNTRYPFNHVIETESGHVMELDDTVGSERIHTFHRSGTFDEMQPDGSRVAKTVGSTYSTVILDSNEIVYNNKHTTTGGNLSNRVKGSVDTSVAGTYGVKVSGTTYLSSSSDINIRGGQPVYIDAPMVYINCRKAKISPTTV